MRHVTLSIFLTLTSSAALGCGAAQPTSTTAAQAPTEAAKLKAPGTAQVGDMTTCLISGETFTVTADQPKVEYEGKTYYLCCPGCAKKFQADPKKYLSKPST